MHYFNYVLYEPDFSDNESYYLTWFDSSYSYSNVGPYGEPLQYHQEELLDESVIPVQKETEDSFPSRYWYSEEITDQDYDTIELPCNGLGKWLDEYESYFAGCWGENMVRHGNDDGGYEPYNGSLEKADNAFICEGEDSSYETLNDNMKHAHNDNQRPGFDFELAHGIYENDHDLDQKDPPAYDDRWSEMRLWESIVGRWPCLVRLDQESQAPLNHWQ